MAELIKRNFSRPDETVEYPKSEGGLIRVGDMEVSYGRADPGWRWSESMGPSSDSDSCPEEHTLFVVSGRLAVLMDDGRQEEFGPGDVGVIPPGHDAWVVGDEPWVAVEFREAK